MIALIMLLLISIPSGLFIAWLARDELIDGRKYFKIITLISFTLMFVFNDYEYIVVSLGFIIISTWISLLKSYDSKWVIVRKN